MEFILIPIWVTFCIVNGILGAKRQIGGVVAFFVSLLFSPIVGFVFVAFSKDEKNEAYKQEMLECNRKIIVLLQNGNKSKIDYDEL